MKKFIIATLFMATAAVTFAQDAAIVEKKTTKHTEALAKAVSLTPEQKAKVHDILLKDFQARMNTDLQKSDEKKYRATVIEIETACDKQIKALLKPDQMKAYQAFCQSVAEQRKQSTTQNKQ
jgi:Spy/CpxP family protein refolding chaperone